TFQAANVFNGLLAGAYQVVVKDSNACTTNAVATVTEPLTAVAISSADVTDVACHGDATGSIKVNATGGTGTLVYSKDDGANFQSSPLFNGLLAGLYQIIVKDAKGCVTTASVTITEPGAALSASINNPTEVNCFGGTTGSATVSVTGGTAGYTYSWNTTPVQTSATASGLSAGNYTATVTDSKGCVTTTRRAHV